MNQGAELPALDPALLVRLALLRAAYVSMEAAYMACNATEAQVTSQDLSTLGR